MGKKLKTYFHNDGKKFAEIHLETKDEHFYIKFFEGDGRLIEIVAYPGKSMHYVRDAADNWCDGILKLDSERLL